ncbi:hypothetical protein KIPB_003298 [Kipferlia bialata]|uniref:Transmembrane protein n=1 Tax=Kipferlia bialata TaxID=797122 RepID=A0A9K3CV69_9EUKA|nr:hypothetical protein KIPB_003298 [Kipferlia bialata]|eukprot:g3298.t1
MQQTEHPSGASPQRPPALSPFSFRAPSIPIDWRAVSGLDVADVIEGNRVEALDQESPSDTFGFSGAVMKEIRLTRWEAVYHLVIFLQMQALAYYLGRYLGLPYDWLRYTRWFTVFLLDFRTLSLPPLHTMETEDGSYLPFLPCALFTLTLSLVTAVAFYLFGFVFTELRQDHQLQRERSRLMAHSASQRSLSGNGSARSLDTARSEKAASTLGSKIMSLKRFTTWGSPEAAEGGMVKSRSQVALYLDTNTTYNREDIAFPDKAETRSINRLKLLTLLYELSVAPCASMVARLMVPDTLYGVGHDSSLSSRTWQVQVVTVYAALVGAVVLIGIPVYLLMHCHRLFPAVDRVLFESVLRQMEVGLGFGLTHNYRSDRAMLVAVFSGSGIWRAVRCCLIGVITFTAYTRTPTTVNTALTGVGALIALCVLGVMSVYRVMLPRVGSILSHLSLALMCAPLTLLAMGSDNSMLSSASLNQTLLLLGVGCVAGVTITFIAACVNKSWPVPKCLGNAPGDAIECARTVSNGVSFVQHLQHLPAVFTDLSVVEQMLESVETTRGLAQRRGLAPIAHLATNLGDVLAAELAARSKVSICRDARRDQHTVDNLREFALARAERLALIKPRWRRVLTKLLVIRAWTLLLEDVRRGDYHVGVGTEKSFSKSRLRNQEQPARVLDSALGMVDMDDVAGPEVSFSRTHTDEGSLSHSDESVTDSELEREIEREMHLGGVDSVNKGQKEPFYFELSKSSSVDDD